MNEYLLASLIGVIMALIELVKYQIKTRKDAKTPADKERQDIVKKIEDLHTWHGARDIDGYPLWYVPRSFVDSQKEIVEKLHEISTLLNHSIHVVEAIEKRLDKKLSGIKIK